jgi:hypothetical protein
MAKRRVGADYSWVGPVIMLGVVGGGAYLVWKYVLPGLQSGNSANNSTTAAANTTAAQQSQQQAAAQGIQPTLNANEMANIANEIYSLGKSASGTSDLDAITNQLAQCNNLADFNGVVAAFGNKNIPSGDVTSSLNLCFSLGVGCISVGLGTFVTTIYNAYDPTGGELNFLNNAMHNIGVTYTF